MFFGDILYLEKNPMMVLLKRCCVNGLLQASTWDELGMKDWSLFCLNPEYQTSDMCNGLLFCCSWLSSSHRNTLSYMNPTMKKCN